MKRLIVSVFALATTSACALQEEAELPASGDDADVAVMVRLVGAAAPGPVLVRVVTAEARVGDGLVVGPPSTAELDLDADVPWDVLALTLTSSTERLELSLRLAPDGSVIQDGVTVPLDLRGPPIAVVADVEQSLASGQVILEIDLEGSLVEAGDGLMLLPMVSVRY